MYKYAFIKVTLGQLKIIKEMERFPDEDRQKDENFLAWNYKDGAGTELVSKLTKAMRKHDLVCEWQDTKMGGSLLHDNVNLIGSLVVLRDAVYKNAS